MNVIPRLPPGAPTPADIKALREQARRTQTQVATLLGVNVRQVQRWEAGQGGMPPATWRLFRLTCGSHQPVDFTRRAEFPRGFDSLRDRARDSIENGDVVELQAIDGPRLQAEVWLDRVHDGLIDEESYGAIVIGFPDTPAQAQAGLFRIGERVTFARANVIHLEQRAPIAAVRTTGA